MPKRSYVLFLSVFTLTARLIIASDTLDSVEISKPTLSVFQEVTHVVKGGNYIAGDGGLNKAWIEPTGGSIAFQAKKNENLTLDVMFAITNFAAPYHYDLPQNFTRNIAVFAPRLDAGYTFGDITHPLFRVDAGIFSYKYNENARNLGEYMFRSWAYPGIIQTGGSFNYLGGNRVSITGLKISQTLGIFSHELLATLETELTPIYDLNLTYMFKLNYHDVLKIGGGVQMARALSATDDPHMTVHYFEDNGTWYASGVLGAGYYAALKEDVLERLKELDSNGTAADSTPLLAELAEANRVIALVDSSINGKKFAKTSTSSATAIKPLLYFSIDPKKWIGGDYWGAKDLILYGEVALLGAQNYPVFYTSPLRRMPTMVGFNLPALKILDVLSFEMEYYASRWLPTYAAPQNLNAAPAPLMVGPYRAKKWDKDNFKWSLYAERALVRGLTVSGQIASDHSRSWDWASYGKTQWEIYTSPSQWYWGLKLGVSI